MLLEVFFRDYLFEQVRDGDVENQNKKPVSGGFFFSFRKFSFIPRARIGMQKVSTFQIPYFSSGVYYPGFAQLWF